MVASDSQWDTAGGPAAQGPTRERGYEILGITHLNVNCCSVQFLETETGKVSTSPGRAVPGR